MPNPNQEDAGKHDVDDDELAVETEPEEGGDEAEEARSVVDRTDADDEDVDDDDIVDIDLDDLGAMEGPDA